MAYLETINNHAYPLKNKTHPEPALPAAILFPRGPEYEWRFQRNQAFDKLDNRFMYKDQGPPAYRLLGPHYNMYATPNKLDYSSYSKSFHYEPRHYNAPHYRANSVTFPTGPPPPQVAAFDGVRPRRSLDPKVASLIMPPHPVKSAKGYDQYRYLPGPPHGVDLYGAPQGWETNSARLPPL